LGIQSILLSGDNEASVSAVAKAVQVDHYFAQTLPHEKLALIEDYQNKGHHVMMVGDGINDSPSLTKADIGVAIGQGSDITIEASDIVLLKHSIYDVYHAIWIAKATLRTIKQNLFWAFAYNVIGIPIAFGILYPFTQTLLSPMLAALAMSLSSISVVANALRLKQKKIK
jgi:Cu+-exporting ATPase